MADVTKQDLVDLENRLDSKLQAMEGRFDAKLEAMEARIEARFNAKLEAMKDSLVEVMRGMQTELLRLLCLGRTILRLG
jgi:hypothetical protein